MDERVVTLAARTKQLANPMGTLHGGILCYNFRRGDWEWRLQAHSRPAILHKRSAKINFSSAPGVGSSLARRRQVVVDWQHDRLQRDVKSG